MIPVPTSEHDLYSTYGAYFLPLIRSRDGTIFEVRGTFTASPYLITVITYANLDEYLKGNRSAEYGQQNPTSWFPAEYALMPVNVPSTPAAPSPIIPTINAPSYQSVMGGNGTDMLPLLLLGAVVLMGNKRLFK